MRCSAVWSQLEPVISVGWAAERQSAAACRWLQPRATVCRPAVRCDAVQRGVRLLTFRRDMLHSAILKISVTCSSESRYTSTRPHGVTSLNNVSTESQMWQPQIWDTKITHAAINSVLSMRRLRMDGALPPPCHGVVLSHAKNLTFHGQKAGVYRTYVTPKQDIPTDFSVTAGSSLSGGHCNCVYPNVGPQYLIWTPELPLTPSIRRVLGECH
jgi:hypothetical protein